MSETIYRGYRLIVTERKANAISTWSSSSMPRLI
jgi:hypothetical protein